MPGKAGDKQRVLPRYEGSQAGGLNLRRLRVANGLTQEALGLAAACEPSYVGRFERGAENPTIDLLESLAQALGEHIAALFEPLPPGYKPPPHLTPGRKSQAD